jgi:nitrate/nitrite-specific signal transduction histidine kinase
MLRREVAPTSPMIWREVTRTMSAAQGAAQGEAQPTREAAVRPVREVEHTLTALQEISRALTVTTQGVPVLLQTIVETVAKVLDCPFVFLVLRNGGSEQFAMYPHRPFGSSELLFPGAWCITEQTLTTAGQMEVVCRAAEGCPCVLPRNLVTVPMSREGALQGSISFHVTGDSGLDEHNSTILRVLANQATVAIENARLFEETERKRRELEAAQDEIDAMAREQIISAERERIARELHDDVAQILAGIGLNVEWCRQQLPPDSVVQERLACLKQLARDGLYEIRHALQGLSPAIVTQLGLVGALEKLVHDFGHISRISAAIEVDGPVRAAGQDAEVALFHICREALYNVFKHAHADHVDVHLTFGPDAVRLSVTDDGVGLDAADAAEDAPTVTFGLANMRSRADELGGRLTIEPGGVRGTRVTARIPG